MLKTLRFQHHLGIWFLL